MKRKHYAYNMDNKPDILLWLFVLSFLVTCTKIASSQPCNFSTILQADVNDTICCDEVQATWSANNPVPLAGYENTWHLDATRPDIGQAFISSLGEMSGQFVKWDWTRPDGLTQPVFTLAGCPPPPPPTLAETNQLSTSSITPELIDISISADYGNWIEINWEQEPEYVSIEWCRNQRCYFLWRGLLSDDKRIDIPYKWLQIRVIDRDGDLMSIVDF